VSGFGLEDASALLRLQGLYIDSFLITDIKALKGAHLSRAIGRIAGTKGKTRSASSPCPRPRLSVHARRPQRRGPWLLQSGRLALAGIVRPVCPAAALV